VHTGRDKPWSTVRELLSRPDYDPIHIRGPAALKIARLGDRFSSLDRDLDAQADQLLH